MSSCRDEAAEFSILRGENEDIPLRFREVSNREAAEGRYYSRYFYTEKPVVFSRGEAFTLTYITSVGETRLEILYDGEVVQRHLLPGSSGEGPEVRCHTVSLLPQDELSGFRLSSEQNGPGDVLSVRLRKKDEYAGYDENGRFFSTDSWGIDLENGIISAIAEQEPEILEIEYSYEPSSPDEIMKGVKIDLHRGDKQYGSLTMYLKRGNRRIYIYPWMWEEEKSDKNTISGNESGRGDGHSSAVTYTLTVPSSGYESIFFRPIDPSIDPEKPLPADLSAIMNFPPEQWRREEYELFAWNLFPNILIFDTRDYDVQAGFFKRLAFYVEKKGYTGQLLTDEGLKGKHGWNAHDYRSIDLASFFQAAADRRFALGEKEILLREVLLSNGIIGYDDEKGLYLPNEGGVISISQSSTPYLRELFLIHEGMHGIFFTASAYRNEIFSLWEEFSLQMKTYWDQFFRWMSYDADNLYLVVNEVQAYLLQQLTEKAEYYFRNHRSVPALLDDPRDGGIIQDLLGRDDTPFQDAAEKIREKLYAATGIWHDRLFCLDNEN